MSINHIIYELKNHFKERPIKIAELGVLRGETIPIILNNFNVKEYIGVDLFDCYEDNKDGSFKLKCFSKHFCSCHSNSVL
tara:strand:- start:198 stop:437 length:240 start_codon:yes stop_codon:yes gene_type:complete